MTNLFTKPGFFTGSGVFTESGAFTKPGNRTKAALLAWAVAASLSCGTAMAALKLGDAAPDFSAPATLGDAQFTYTLSAVLKKGPAVVYFYPKAFTSGCTAEAHAFAEAMPKFTELGATVIGVSQDNIEKLQKFATSECRKKFPVAADRDGSISKAYDAVMGPQFIHYSNRTSYAIAPDGKVIGVWSAEDADEHVSKMLAALKNFKPAK